MAIDGSKCCGCGACANICPRNCIQMKADSEGFYYPKVDLESCIDCGLCEKVCPIGKEDNIAEPEVYAAVSKNDIEREKSSSGGIFSLLAREILDRGGRIYGAAYDESLQVHHTSISQKEYLPLLQGSKYVQSRTENVYSEISELLNNNVPVLFSGTPCQVYGLKSFLRKEYDNLFCVDLICHGAPSPEVWNHYIHFYEKKAHSMCTNAFFRDKRLGWHRFSVVLQFSAHEEFSDEVSKDLFMKAFMDDACLRPYCYECEFKGFHRQSDLTLADFWGIERILPDMDDDKGTSMVMVNSRKGQALFSIIQKSIISETVDLSCVRATNHSYYDPPKLPSYRSKFMKKISDDNFENIVKKYCFLTFEKRAKAKIKRMLGVK